MKISSEAIWVAHPKTGRQINVAPLFNALDEFDREPTSSIASGGLDVVRQIIRTLNITVHDPQFTSPVYIANLYQDLHRLEDMFAEMTEK